MKGDRYSIVDLFNDGSPSNSKEGDNAREIRERAIEVAKQRAKSNLQAPEKSNPTSVEESTEAEERPKTNNTSFSLNWNPHSPYAGPSRIIQAIPPIKKLAEKFVRSGRNYSEIDVINEGEFPDIMKTGSTIVSLERDKLIADGYKTELDIVDKAEAGELPKDSKYFQSKKLIDSHLNNLQRDKNINLNGNREFLVKKLANPKDERMYSSLNLLYFYCEGFDEIDSHN